MKLIRSNPMSLSPSQNCRLIFLPDLRVYGSFADLSSTQVELVISSDQPSEYYPLSDQILISTKTQNLTLSLNLTSQKSLETNSPQIQSDPPAKSGGRKQGKKSGRILKGTTQKHKPEADL